MNQPKWLPRDLQDSFYLFNEFERMVTRFKFLGKQFTIQLSLSIPDIEVSLLNISTKYNNITFFCC